jgi:hypothetical protein
MITPVVQRWRARRDLYRPAGEPIVASHYEVAEVDHSTAKRFVEQHHYLGTFPAARWCFGLFWGGLLVGTAVFSVPSNDRVITCVLPGAAVESVELGRLVLLDLVPANGESFFVARCFNLLRKEGLVGVVSFSDPVPRTTAVGATIFRGHAGTVYQALNAVFTGRGTARTLRLLPDGAVFSARAAQKIRAGERGMRYAAAQLVRAGAPPLDLERVSEEERRAWLRAAVAGVTRPLRHDGCFRYVWALDRRARRHLPASQPPSLALPDTVFFAAQSRFPSERTKLRADLARMLDVNDPRARVWAKAILAKVGTKGRVAKEWRAWAQERRDALKEPPKQRARKPRRVAA